MLDLSKEVDRKLSQLDIAQARALDFLYTTYNPTPLGRAIGNAFFVRGCRVIFARVGRGGSKSYSCAEIAAQYAIEVPKRRIYYFAPLKTQVRDIIWFPGILDEFIDPGFIASKDKQDLRYTLLNGSYIKLDGSDNFNACRGFKGHLYIADEFREFHPAWLEAMMPNLISKRATIIFAGTPPEFPVTEEGEKHHYVMMDEETRHYAKSDPGYAAWFHMPSSVNPANDAEDLERERQRLLRRGEKFVWDREFEALIVTGASTSIFPMVNKDRHFEPHENLIKLVQSNPSRYELWCVADPATRSVFGVIFMAIDHYSSTVLWLDELYETDASETVAKKINPRILETIENLTPEEDFGPADLTWNFYSDPAGADYMEESADDPENPIEWTAAQKQPGDKLTGLATMKTLFLEREHCVSDRCQMFMTELILYVRNKNGHIVKKRDHLIDGSRYGIKESGFDFNEQEFVVRETHEDPEEKNYLISAIMEYRRKALENNMLVRVMESYGEAR